MHQWSHLQPLSRIQLSLKPLFLFVNQLLSNIHFLKTVKSEMPGQNRNLKNLAPSIVSYTHGTISVSKFTWVHWVTTWDLLCCRSRSKEWDLLFNYETQQAFYRKITCPRNCVFLSISTIVWNRTQYLDVMFLACGCFDRIRSFKIELLVHSPLCLCVNYHSYLKFSHL